MCGFSNHHNVCCGLLAFSHGTFHFNTEVARYIGQRPDQAETCRKKFAICVADTLASVRYDTT